MWQRFSLPTKGLCIGLWMLFYLMSAHAARAATAPDANSGALAGLHGHYTLAETERYRGGLSTPGQIRSKFGTGLSISSDRFDIGSETWHSPRYRLRSYPVVPTEGEVAQGQWSHFFGYGIDRKSIDVLEIRQSEHHQQARQYNFEIIGDNEIWFLYDGWLLRFKKKTTEAK